MRDRLLLATQAVLIVVDLQETYRDKLHEWTRTAARAAVLIRGARLLGIPTFCTEQYPKGLGPTAPEIRSALEDAPILEKLSFSALGAPGLTELIRAQGRPQAIVCGIETHVCINHTVHDLIELGFHVHLPVDALSSRHVTDHEIGLRKMLGSGAIPASTESALLECMRGAEHPKFRAVQALLK